jgi:hypothetical protein
LARRFQGEPSETRQVRKRRAEISIDVSFPRSSFILATTIGQEKILPMQINPQAPAHGLPPSKWLLQRRWPLFALAIWLLATLGFRPLMLPDEGRYVEVAREMLLGDGSLPTLFGLPFLHKPPLMYWLDLAAMKVLGVNVFAARLAPAFGAWLMGAALYADVYRRHGPRAAALALGVLATCPFYFFGAQYANLDMLVAGLVTVAVLCARRSVDEPRHADLQWLFAAWSAMAFAVLAKGLIGVVLPALVIGPWLLWQGRWRALLRLMHPLAMLAFAVIALPWFIALQWRFPQFFDYFIVEQHFRRYAESNFNNAQPFWFFAAVVPLLTLPWSLWLPSVLRKWRVPGSPTSTSASSTQRAEGGLYAWWTIAILGFFSLPTSKLLGYALPALAPLVALLALHSRLGRAIRWVMPAAASFCLALLVFLTLKAPGSHRDIGLALGAQMKPGERVVFVDEPYFDVPFYAGLKQPPFVLSNWLDPTIARDDTWRKALYDTARFDPRGAAERLLSVERVAALLCESGTVWFVATRGWQAPVSFGELTNVLQGKEDDLLRSAGVAQSHCE